MIVKRSVLNVSSNLLPEHPCHMFELSGTSPLADLITNTLTLTSE